jgi:hypothetical protein
VSLNDLPDMPEPDLSHFEQAERELFDRLSKEDNSALFEQILNNEKHAERELFERLANEDDATLLSKLLDDTDTPAPDEGEN